MKTTKKLTIGVLLAAMGLSASAQLKDWGCSDEVQQQMLEPVSLYQENVKQFKASKDQRYLEEAYPYWKQVVANCPRQSKNLYLNGANILKVKIAKAQNAEERNALIQELMAMYDTRIAQYGEAAKYTAKKASEIEDLLKELLDYARLYEVFTKSQFKAWSSTTNSTVRPYVSAVKTSRLATW